MKKFRLIAATALTSLLFLLLAEGLLRLTGSKPWVTSDRFPDEPTLHERDSVLGWHNKQGTYLMPRYDQAGKEVRMTFLDEGVRTTGASSPHGSHEILLLGCSYTQGYAIDDEDTFPWKLQQLVPPSLRIVNLGTAGYGTYQSLLMLERELPRRPATKLVLYAFIENHEFRNVAPADWLRILAKNTRRGHVEVPFATISESGGLERHPPERYSSFPARELFALPAFIEKQYMRFSTRERLHQRRQVTEQILLDMDRVSKESAANFAVVLLHGTPAVLTHYEAFLHAHDIPVIYCNLSLTPGLLVAGEGHPNGAANSRWASCIAGSLEGMPDLLTN